MKKCKIRFEDVGINEILRIVDNINNEIYNQCGDEGILYRPVSFECDGYICQYFNRAWIKFFDTTIWDSEESEREFYEYKNEYESLENYLRKEIRSIIKTFSKIKI